MKTTQSSSMKQVFPVTSSWQPLGHRSSSWSLEQSSCVGRTQRHQGGRRGPGRGPEAAFGAAHGAVSLAPWPALILCWLALASTCTVGGSQETQPRTTHMTPCPQGPVLFPQIGAGRAGLGLFSGRSSCLCLLINYQKTKTLEGSGGQEWMRQVFLSV